MGLFSFGDQFAMFDVTPVENQFILEYMPGARGEFVKVYLYGLLHCYHPQENMSIQQMSHDIDVSEEDILAAYRHWERKGLVRRISDQPPVWQYLNKKEQILMHADTGVDSAYETFAEALHAQFGHERKLSGKEINLAYEWVEELGLPMEVVLLLVQHKIETRGKNFTMKSAEPLAVTLASEKAHTLEDAEVVLRREKDIYEGSKRIVRRLGKRREPSVPEQEMYRKWVREWGYTYSAIEAACSETTKGEPTFAYLEGILQGMMRRNGGAMTSAAEVNKRQSEDKTRIEPLKALLQQLNTKSATINENTLSAYHDMRQLYGDDIILLAGKECAARGKSDLDSVRQLLNVWKRRNLQSAEEIKAYMQLIDKQNTLISSLFEAWGSKSRITAGDRALVQKWKEEWGFSSDFILYCGMFAANAEKHMPYLDGVLKSFHEKNITTPEAAAAAHREYQLQQTKVPAAAAQKPGKTVIEQQYEQRTYETNNDLPDWMIKRMEERRRNG
ncbi:MAG: DnaD domain protein [Clostridia bacterium]|nr:DnaD domain protein [Clostridia bacterium]